MTAGPEETMLSSEVTIFSKIGVVGSRFGTRADRPRVAPARRVRAGATLPGGARPGGPHTWGGGRRSHYGRVKEHARPTQGQAAGQAGVAAARSVGGGRQRGHRANGQAEPQMIRTHHRQRAGAQVVRRLNSPTDDPSRGPPITRRTPTGSAPATAGTPARGCLPAASVVDGASRRCGERLSITPRKPDGVNHRFPTDQPPSLVASPPECYICRPRPWRSLSVHAIRGRESFCDVSHAGMSISVSGESGVHILPSAAGSWPSVVLRLWWRHGV